VKGTITAVGGGLTADAPLASFGQVNEGGAVSAMQMTMTVPGAGSYDFIAIDDTLYLSGTLAAPYGTQYVAVNESTTDPQLAPLYTTFSDAINSASANSYVNFLTLATQTKDAGAEPINGIDTEKYTMVLDLTRLDTTDVDPATKTSFEALAKSGVTEVPCTFWVDADGRVIRVEQLVELSGQSVTSTIDFTDYNVPLEIVAPDPSLVTVAK
jgi:hypothetical protein